MVEIALQTVSDHSLSENPIYRELQMMHCPDYICAQGEAHEHRFNQSMNYCDDCGIDIEDVDE
jgi:hypothetical protein